MSLLNAKFRQIYLIGNSKHFTRKTNCQIQLFMNLKLYVSTYLIKKKHCCIKYKIWIFKYRASTLILFVKYWNVIFSKLLVFQLSDTADENNLNNFVSVLSSIIYINNLNRYLRYFSFLHYYILYYYQWIYR